MAGHQHHGRKEGRVAPKGCMAIVVGSEGEEQQRFVVPVAYVNHPLFAGLLKEAEEEYGFEQKGAITIPCNVECFQRVIRGIIDQESGGGGGGGGAAHHSHHSHQHHHSGHLHMISGCFMS